MNPLSIAIVLFSALSVHGMTLNRSCSKESSKESFFKSIQYQKIDKGICSSYNYKTLPDEIPTLWLSNIDESFNYIKCKLYDYMKLYNVNHIDRYLGQCREDDILFIGSDLASLNAAWSLLKNGYKVTLVCHEEIMPSLEMLSDYTKFNWIANPKFSSRFDVNIGKCKKTIYETSLFGGNSNYLGSRVLSGKFDNLIDRIQSNNFWDKKAMLAAYNRMYSTQQVEKVETTEVVKEEKQVQQSSNVNAGLYGGSSSSQSKEFCYKYKKVTEVRSHDRFYQLAFKDCGLNIHDIDNSMIPENSGLPSDDLLRYLLNNYAEQFTLLKDVRVNKLIEKGNLLTGVEIETRNGKTLTLGCKYSIMFGGSPLRSLSLMASTSSYLRERLTKQKYKISMLPSTSLIIKIPQNSFLTRNLFYGRGLVPFLNQRYLDESPLENHEFMIDLEGPYSARVCVRTFSNEIGDTLNGYMNVVYQLSEHMKNRLLQELMNHDLIFCTVELIGPGIPSGYLLFNGNQVSIDYHLHEDVKRMLKDLVFKVRNFVSHSKFSSFTSSILLDNGNSVDSYSPSDLSEDLITNTLPYMIHFPSTGPTFLDDKYAKPIGFLDVDNLCLCNNLVFPVAYLPQFSSLYADLFADRVHKYYSQRKANQSSGQDTSMQTSKRASLARSEDENNKELYGRRNNGLDKNNALYSESERRSSEEESRSQSKKLYAGRKGLGKGLSSNGFGRDYDEDNFKSLYSRRNGLGRGLYDDDSQSRSDDSLYSQSSSSEQSEESSVEKAFVSNGLGKVQSYRSSDYDYDKEESNSVTQRGADGSLFSSSNSVQESEASSAEESFESDGLGGVRREKKYDQEYDSDKDSSVSYVGDDGVYRHNSSEEKSGKAGYEAKHMKDGFGNVYSSEEKSMETQSKESEETFAMY